MQSSATGILRDFVLEGKPNLPSPFFARSSSAVADLSLAFPSINSTLGDLPRLFQLAPARSSRNSPFDGTRPRRRPLYPLLFFFFSSSFFRIISWALVYNHSSFLVAVVGSVEPGTVYSPHRTLLSDQSLVSSFSSSVSYLTYFDLYPSHSLI